MKICTESPFEICSACSPWLSPSCILLSVLSLPLPPPPLPRKDSSLFFMWFMFIFVIQGVGFIINAAGFINLGSWCVDGLVTKYTDV